MKTILWDEHNCRELIENIPIRGKSNKKDVWFYIYCADYETYLLFHNVEL